MRDNLELAPATWHDFYAVTGFAPGADVIVCSGGGTGADCASIGC